jgi:uncharacterized surface protein with fasciclin (FAS1) repeats
MNTKFSPIRLLAIVGALGVGFAPGAIAQIQETAPEMDTTEAILEEVTDEVAQATGDIVDVASANPEFETLVTAIQTAELVEPLKGEGPFTVFAPTNAAFDALPDGVVDALLLPENQDLLTQVLTYHVVPGELMASDLSTGMVETLGGEDVMVTVEGGSVMVDEADVVAANVPATNGVIHVIDEVLVPMDVAAELESRLAASESEMMAEPTPVQGTTVEETTVEETAPAEPIRGLW